MVFALMADGSLQSVERSDDAVVLKGR